VDIAAPGGNTRVDQNGDGRPDGVMQHTLKNGKTDEHDFLLYMGTSMASPHVAAAAALVVAQGVTHPDKVEAVLEKSADDSQKDRYDDAKEYQERYGAGIMQADRAAKAAAGEPGGWRLGVTFLLGLLAFGRLRRKDMLDISPSATPLFVGSALLASSGLFFLPMLFGDGGMLTGVMGALSHPIAELDLVLLGPSFDQNPLLASALIPLAAVLTLGGSKRWKYLGAGLAIGFAGFLFTESVILTSDVHWIPGMDLLDRAWLLVNGAVSLVLGYLTLKRY
jgi:serine protease